jgi:hypothetical protein
MKTFGQLKAGDEVYVIKGNDVEFVKVQSTEVDTRHSQMVTVEIEDIHFYLSAVLSSIHEYMISGIYCDIYCDVYEAIREMKKRYNANVITCKQSLDSLHLLEECIPAYRKN